MLYTALAFENNSDTKIILERVIAIEKALINQHSPTENDDKKYKAHLRSLFMNIKDPKNPNLRSRISSGELSVETLTLMNAHDLASEERKAKDREIAEKNLFAARGASEAEAESDIYQVFKWVLSIKSNVNQKLNSLFF